jgi:hypothetical protein
MCDVNPALDGEVVCGDPECQAERAPMQPGMSCGSCDGYGYDGYLMCVDCGGTGICPVDVLEALWESDQERRREQAADLARDDR